VTWFEQTAACFFSRITNSHHVPAASDYDYIFFVGKWPSSRILASSF